MDINQSAPVVAHSTIEISAEQEKVWETLLDVERWPEWNPEVKSAKLEGGVHVGSVFRWSTGSGTIRSTFQRTEPPRHVAWTGRIMGINAIHAWNLQPNGAGGTTVSTAESFEGLFARLFHRRFQRMLQKTLDNGLRFLKAEIER